LFLPEKEGFPAKLICGVLYHPDLPWKNLLNELEHHWGPIERQSCAYLFSEGSDYYHREMGPEHYRCFLSFEGVMDPGQLPNIKRQSIAIEQNFAKGFEECQRPVNLDPGLIMRGRMVLATTKDFSHRLYLGEGIYGEVTLLFKKNRIETLPWTYPDIAAGHYNTTLLEARLDYEESI
jgi:hypothetical protein